jgi:hypothetical protein
MEAQRVRRPYTLNPLSIALASSGGPSRVRVGT